MSTPDDVKARVSTAYNFAADYYDAAANSFWERFGRGTIDRLGIPRRARVLDLCCGLRDLREDRKWANIAQ
jgi:hypothetical protein